MKHFLIIKFLLYTIAIIFIDALVVVVAAFIGNPLFNSYDDLIKLISLSSGLIFVILLSRKPLELLDNLKKKFGFKQISLIILLLLLFLLIEYLVSLSLNKNNSQSVSYDTLYIFRIVLLIPFLEELVFRGIFQISLTKKYGWKIAVFLSSILFMLIHFGEAPHMLMAFVFSIATGVILFKTNSLFLVILFHVLFNLALILIEFNYL